MNPLDHGNSKEDWERAHQALAANKEIWDRLQFRGVQHGGSGKGYYECRHCPRCGSVILRPVTARELFVLLSDASTVVALSLVSLGSEQ